jgi:hypothetical protein
LDDNTFTNKTWSEVSGMKVVDLNIMELEFLDVLKFRLSIQKEEYERWRTALFGFRSQLINVPIEIQRQKLMETMALSVNNTQWAQKQQQNHNFFLFSKQQYPVQPTFHGPLTRVPLRIPSQPVYHHTNVYNEQKTYAYQAPPLPLPTAQRSNYAQQQTSFHTPSTTKYPYDQRASHRTSSLPSNGGLDLAANYYATPSATPTYNYPSTTSYYVDPSSNTTTTTTTYNSSNSPTDYNPYHKVNAAYNRSTIPRSTSYKVSV